MDKSIENNKLDEIYGVGIRIKILTYKCRLNCAVMLLCPLTQTVQFY